MKLVLGSSSPSRKGLLRAGGIDPLIHAPNVDEEAVLACHTGASAKDAVLALAEAKAQAVAPLYPEDVVVACDSMLLLDGKLQGKPKTVDRAVERWRQQRGKTAELLTGHCVVLPETAQPSGGDSIGTERVHHVECVRTLIRFGSPSDADIRAYAEGGEPLFCAGAFTLEAQGAWFIDSIEGDPSSVIGLSLPLVRRVLAEYGVDISSLWNRGDHAHN
ncbi:Septum formation protein Maf [Corynebacterium ciconiae DSM 44920]|uniref:Maf family protein n=1 Tax=Corynebacterium ciconiae TaxID=227319 RepID=UPI0003A836B9|nr:nucleoside triphosphate pyrophosphatase [Corynebacterium ciconiae]WKD61837.1 Septum formation protein Maf [Corynebacterium ciconiae DSM 44920]